MRIVCLGGGPAGLYFSILMKLADRAHDITVIERNRPYDTFGFGVVFSDATLDNLKEADPVTHAEILRNFMHWDHIDVRVHGQSIVSGGHGMCGLGRKKLLNILQDRASELGVKLVFDTEVTDDAPYAGADLIVASDGINSIIRNKYAEQFEPDLDKGKCRYIWLGTHRHYQSFIKAFEDTEHGWFEAHVYPYDQDTSTFIVECREETWKKSGLDNADVDASIAFSEKVFAKLLDGARLISNARHLRGSAWLNFIRVKNKTWQHQNIVLIGDAAHTAHFSIGSGTKLAMEDAIALVHAFQRHRHVPIALKEYEAERQAEVAKLQSAARNSMQWSENVARYSKLEPLQFAYSLMTRSQRIGHENLKERGSDFVEKVENWLANKCGLPNPVPPMFTPLALRGMELGNRVAVAPVAMDSCHDGTPDDAYLVHMGTRAMGGAALVFTEMAAVSRHGRVTPSSAGLYKDEHQAAWTRIVEFVHQWTPAKIALQLGHAGPKGSSRPGWESAEPLLEGGWPLMAASAVPYGPHSQVPKAMTREDMDGVTADFVHAAELAAGCGFDMLELHCGHGLLLASFITPLLNKLQDEYGGTLANRLRYPLEVFSAVRAVWPQDKPISVQISAHDWVEGGITLEDAILIAQRFKQAGADLIHVSSGLTSAQAKPVYGRMYQTPFSDAIRNDVGIATLAVGNITDYDQVNSIIAAGRADLCALGRPHLTDPYWTLHAAAQQNFTDMPWPKQYLAGKAQLERNLQRAAQPQVGAI